jgi:hypothetical protein
MSSKDLSSSLDENLHQEDSRKRQYRWNPSRYVSLLRLVILRTPYAAPYKSKVSAWDAVANEYNEAEGEPNAITGRKAKEKFEFLLATFRKEEAESLRKSGTDEEYDEMKRLLEELDELERDSRAISDGEKEALKRKVYFKKSFSLGISFLMVLCRTRRKKANLMISASLQ